MFIVTTAHVIYYIDEMDLSNLGKFGDLAKQMQGAYSDGTNAMNQAGKEVAKDMNPDHEIELDIQLSAKVEGHVGILTIFNRRRKMQI